VVWGRHCPLEPQLYRQKAVCEAEGVPFHSTIDLLAAQIHSFQPLAGTRTQVLLDSWYAAKGIWTAARKRDFLITTGLKNNRSLRVADPAAPKGWRWQRLSAYAADLSDADYQPVSWPSQGEEPRQVWVQVVTTRVKTLYRCQVLIVRERLDAPLKDTRYFASSDLGGEVATLGGTSPRGGRWRCCSPTTRNCWGWTSIR